MAIYVYFNGEIRQFATIEAVENGIGKVPCYDDSIAEFHNCGWRMKSNQYRREVTSPQGEIKVFSTWDPELFARIATLRSWQEYDNFELRKKEKFLQIELNLREVELTEIKDRLRQAEKWSEGVRNTLEEIYDINEGGGPNSRKRVKELLLKYVDACEGCGKAVCLCE